MSETTAYHANVTSISQDDFDHMKGYYHYASGELLETIKILKESTQEYDEEGNIRRGKKRIEEVTLPIERVQQMLSNLEDLEYRLRKMFVVNEEFAQQVSERMKRLHAEGKMKKRGKLAKGVAKLRKAR